MPFEPVQDGLLSFSEPPHTKLLACCKMGQPYSLQAYALVMVQGTGVQPACLPERKPRQKKKSGL